MPSDQSKIVQGLQRSEECTGREVTFFDDQSKEHVQKRCCVAAGRVHPEYAPGQIRLFRFSTIIFSTHPTPVVPVGLKKQVYIKFR